MKTETEQEKIIQLITFKIDEKVYAFDISLVKEINKISTVTKVPQADDFIDGVMNLRGAIIPVINIRKRFCMEAIPYSSKSKLIIVDFEGDSVGVIVDEISEVVKISSENIESDREKMDEIGIEFIEGIGKTDDGIIPVMDIFKLIGRERIDNAAL